MVYQVCLCRPDQLFHKQNPGSKLALVCCTTAKAWQSRAQSQNPVNQVSQLLPATPASVNAVLQGSMFMQHQCTASTASFAPSHGPEHAV